MFRVQGRGIVRFRVELVMSLGFRAESRGFAVSCGLM